MVRHRRLPPLHGAEPALRHVEQRLLLRNHPRHAADLGNFDIDKDNDIGTNLQGIFGPLVINWVLSSTEYRVTMQV